jgi:hypothetical protein
MTDRIKDVNSFQILDTPAETLLDEITELASIIFKTPISLITILDTKRQWFKSNKGISVCETKIEDSFCQHSLDKPNEVLVVKDALKDERFTNNNLVINEPKIRFYAGAPLVTKDNNVLGNLCVIDRKPRDFSSDDEKVLQILARKAMEIIETNRIFSKMNTTHRLNVERLVNITENIPVGLFELEVSSTGKMRFTFLSKGMTKINPNLNLDKWINDEDLDFDHVHPDDVQQLKDVFQNAAKRKESLKYEYRVKTDTGYNWHAMCGQPQIMKNGKAFIYGAFSDITAKVEYQKALEQILFDISHVMRKPVTKIMGLTDLIEAEEDLSYEKLKEFTSQLKIVTKELEEYTRKLNDVYYEKTQKIISQNNI